MNLIHKRRRQIEGSSFGDCGSAEDVYEGVDGGDDRSGGDDWSGGDDQSDGSDGSEG